MYPGNAFAADVAGYYRTPITMATGDANLALGFNISNIDFFLAKHINLGLNLKFYFKIAAYEGEYFEPMSRTMESFGLYVKYLF